MRKKLLRSRSGFEKPESREEAIMQNILGASNVLEPAESNIEKILQAILYNTPYTKEPETNIEEILLAIKNNGTYTGECESRDMKILFAILNESTYNEEPESRIEELFIEWLQQRSQIKVLEGVPPLTFTSRGLPLINYLIEGNTVQNGTPTPDSPVIPQGTGERTGNLFDYKTAYSAYLQPDGSLNATASQINQVVNYFDLNLIGQTVTISVKATNVLQTRVMILTKINGVEQESNAISTNNTGIMKISVTPTSTNDYWRISFGSGASLLTNYSDFMLNSGSSPLPYEPYGYKIPISSANTTTPVYLGEVETTRKIKKLVLTGEENNWRKYEQSTSSWLYFLPIITGAIINVICSHAPYSVYIPQSATVGARLTNSMLFLLLNLGNIIESNTLDDFKSYLAQQYAAGTPVTIWYVLATEETGIVNEPLMKIGDYADTLSMEQAGVQIPTVNGSNTLDVDTTVKPSNVYIEYK